MYFVSSAKNTAKSFFFKFLLLLDKDSFNILVQVKSVAIVKDLSSFLNNFFIRRIQSKNVWLQVILTALLTWTILKSTTILFKMTTTNDYINRLHFDLPFSLCDEKPTKAGDILRYRRVSGNQALVTKLCLASHCSNPVSWGCRIHQVHFCEWVRSSLSMSVLDITLNHLMAK